ncbi:hypothetical protein ACNO5E_20475 [Vibrio parahaemolyticus]
MYPVIRQDKTSNAKEIHILSVNTLDSLISINIKRKDIVSKWTILKDKFDNTANYYATADDLVFLSRLANNLTGAVNPVHINYYSGQAHFVFTGTPALKIKLRVLGSRAPNANNRKLCCWFKTGNSIDKKWDNYYGSVS